MIDEELEPGQTGTTEIAAGVSDDRPPVAEQPEPTVPNVGPSAAAPSATEEQPMSMEEALQDESLRNVFEGTFKRVKRGQLVHGTIVRVDTDRVFVDLGGKTEGVIQLNELASETLTTAEGFVSVGDQISAVVLQSEGKDGNAELSKKRADFEDSWVKIEEAHKNQVTITAPVTERVKGGLVVDIGVRGFVPATHVGNGKLRNIERYVGMSIPLKILEIDRDRRKVVLSNRLAEDELRSTAKNTVFSSLQVGDIVDGVVRRLVDYGAFVDVGGVDGLLHVSEMSWTRVNHPSEVLKDGDEIKVKVLRLDPESGKISLGYRQVLPDPWSVVAERYKPEQVIEAPISRIVQTGAFVKLPEGVEAWLPVREMSQRRIGKPSDVVSEGQIVKVQIRDMKPKERRMEVSLRALEQDAERQVIEKHTRNTHRGGATIGERLGALKQFLTDDEPHDVVAVIEEPAAEPKKAKAAKAPKAAKPEPVAEATVAEAPVESSNGEAEPSDPVEPTAVAEETPTA